MALSVFLYTSIAIKMHRMYGKFKKSIDFIQFKVLTLLYTIKSTDFRTFPYTLLTKLLANNYMDKQI